MRNYHLDCNTALYGQTNEICTYYKESYDSLSDQMYKSFHLLMKSIPLIYNYSVLETGMFPETKTMDTEKNNFQIIATIVWKDKKYWEKNKNKNKKTWKRAICSSHH